MRKEVAFFTRATSATKGGSCSIKQEDRLGGDAELELVDSLDPFNEGIIFSIWPPKKSW
jgi:chromosome segregation ATPase